MDMRIIESRQALVAELRNPSRVLNAVPTAKPLTQYEGMVAVPHRIDEVRVLNNLGIRAPSPILHYYNWPGRFTPFKAQRLTAAMLTLNPRAFVLNEVGTGKSMSALWAYDYLRIVGEAKRLLVIAPLSTLERTWADEVFFHMTHLTVSVLHGTRAKRLKALKQEADVYVINHDGVGVILDELIARSDITHVVIDELAHAARNSRTRKWKAFYKLVNSPNTQRSCWGMTGTPIPNSPTDAYAQAKLVVPHKSPRSFSRFREETMRQYGPFKWLPRDDAMDSVRRIMSPAVRFTRDECMDLPDCMYEDRDTPMSDRQAKAYKTMATKLVAEAEGGQILAVNEAVKLNKLVQIACGVAYDSDGKEVFFEPKERIAELLNIINSTPYKVIVYVPYVSTINMVLEQVRTVDPDAECVYGGVSKNKRDQVFKSFQSMDQPKVLVAQPAAMSHGLTLTKASTIVWYGPTTSNETYEQANGRITRPGQKNKQFIIHLGGTDIERRIYKRLQEKQSMQGVLLDAVKANRLT